MSALTLPEFFEQYFQALHGHRGMMSGIDRQQVCVDVVRQASLYGELYYTTGNTQAYADVPGQYLRPGLVIAPSSAGVCDVRERSYANYFASAGFMCFVVDSFTRRGLKHCVDDQSRLPAADLARDVLAGWRFLAGRTDTDATRIAVLGVSKGAGAALDTALRLPFQSYGPECFAAHVAIAPPASLQPRHPVTTNAPIFMLIGGQDDFTGTEPALRYAHRLRTGGADVRVHVFPEAHHAWESCGQVRYYPQAQCFKDCHFLLEDDGSYTDECSGENMNAEAFEQAYLRCMRLGAHAGGGSSELRSKTCELILQFFVENGLCPLR